jgi:hypothetical protein
VIADKDQAVDRWARGERIGIPATDGRERVVEVEAEQNAGGRDP